MSLLSRRAIGLSITQLRPVRAPLSSDLAADYLDRGVPDEVGQFGTPHHAGLVARAIDVVFNGPHRYRYRLGDLTIGQSLRDEHGDLALTVSKRRRKVGSGDRRALRSTA